MAEFLDEEQFLKLVATRLNSNPNSDTKVAADGDTVTGSLAEIVFAAFDVNNQHGPVLFGD